MAATIVTVVPDPLHPERALSVKICDRHDFITLREKVRWQLKDNGDRYAPGAPLEFVFFDDKRNTLRVANHQQLARALSFAPKQLHNGRLVLFVHQHPESTGQVSQTKASETELPAQDNAPASNMKSVMMSAKPNSFERESPVEIVEGLRPSIGNRPPEISTNVWSCLNQIANGQITSYPQFALVLSRIGNLSDDTEYPALHYCLRTMTPTQHQAFFQTLLPLIGRLALADPQLKRTLRQGGDELSLSRLQASSIVANIFLCSLTNSPDSSRRRLSMSAMFRSDPFPAVTKIDALLHYLSSVQAHPSAPTPVRIHRVHRDLSSWTMAHLQQCRQSTTIAVDRTDLRSSSAPIHLEQIRSRSLAEAALGPDSTPEILRLFEAPELMAAAALCEPLRRYDAIVVSGGRRFVCLSGEGNQIRIKKINAGDPPTTMVVLFQISRENCDRFHPRTLLDEILQLMAAMRATDTASIATSSGHLYSPHRIDLDRDFLVKIIAAMATNRDLSFYTESDGRMAAYPSIAAMLNGYHAADLIRFLNGYRPSMGSLWSRLQEFLKFDQSVIKRH